MPNAKRLTKRQRDILVALSRRDGQPAWLLTTSRSGNVIERLLALGFVRVQNGKVYSTIEGREAIRRTMPNATYTITALLVKDGQLARCEIAAKDASTALQDIYRLTGCDIVETGATYLGEKAGQGIALFVDEEALLKERPEFCALVVDKEFDEARPIYGRGAIFVGTTRSGNWRALTEREIAGFQLAAPFGRPILTYTRPAKGAKA